MSLFEAIRNFRKKPTASVAKERLQIIIAHERTQRDTEDFLPRLQQELVEVIAKYIDIDKEAVSVQIDRSGDSAVLELNVSMPDKVLEEEAV